MTRYPPAFKLRRPVESGRYRMHLAPFALRAMDAEVGRFARTFVTNPGYLVSSGGDQRSKDQYPSVTVFADQHKYTQQKEQEDP